MLIIFILNLVVLGCSSWFNWNSYKFLRRTKEHLNKCQDLRKIADETMEEANKMRLHAKTMIEKTKGIKNEA